MKMSPWYHGLCVLLLAWLWLAPSGCITGKESAGDGGGAKDGKGPAGDLAVKKDKKGWEGGGPADSKGPGDGPLPRLDAWPGQLSRTGWALVRPGWFYMGSPTNELCHGAAETRHRVDLTHEIEVMQAEVTQGEYKSRFSNYNPSGSWEKQCGDGCPVTAVSWYMAAAYCNELSKEMSLELCYQCTGTPQSVLSCTYASPFSGSANPIYNCKGFRLPTEAEWEYAYRAGTQTAFYNGNDTNPLACISCTPGGARPNAIAWYCGNSGSDLKPVKQKTANLWLLHDMAGNAYEWVDDWYQKDLGAQTVTNPWVDLPPTATQEKVLRGGCWLSSPANVRAAHRSSFEPSSTSTRYLQNGFRCVRTLK